MVLVHLEFAFASGSTQAASSSHVADAVFVNVIPTLIPLGNAWGRKVVIFSPKHSNETEITFQTLLRLVLNTISLCLIISIKSLNHQAVALFHVNSMFLLRFVETLDERETE